MTIRMILIITITLCSFYKYGKAADKIDESSALASVSFFSVGMNGFAGKESEGEGLYKSMLAKKNAEALFIALAENPRATPEARLYAACGLRKLGLENRERLFLRDKDEKVTVLKGDILRQEKFHSVYKIITAFGCE